MVLTNQTEKGFLLRDIKLKILPLGLIFIFAAKFKAKT